MSRPTSRLRTALVLCAVLALVLLVSPASAGSLHAAPSAPSFWALLWESLVGCERGPLIDPNGGVCTATVSSGDKGPLIDPNGGGRTATASGCDRGAWIDPNGGCLQ
ncbi:MAG TPA: hypothetical protein VH988_17500 [Thermoanaerobaculia bacterium]|nr:hypothetical protein [Thermoanaerobaculia bacterium]